MNPSKSERAALLLVIAVVTLACWAWIVPMARDMYGAMAGPSAWMMTAEWDTAHLLLLAAMWTVMMAGMMLPSAVPALLLYSGAARHRNGGRAAVRVYAMAAGYLLVWIGFSVCATLLQRLASRLLLLTPMMEASSRPIAGAVLIVAGIYQVTPFKRACLGSCASPVDFLMRRWHEGLAGAWRMGVEHGLACLGCCWALMLLLFAGGVMNLAVIAALMALVLFEKLTPIGPRSVVVTGLLLLAGGLWLVSHSP